MRRPTFRRPRRRSEPPCVGCGQSPTPEPVVPGIGEVPEADDVPRREPGRLTAVLEAGLVVLHPGTGRFQVLSTSAALVYLSIDGQASVAAMAADLSAEVGGAPPGEILADVRAAIGSMVHEGLVALGPGPGATPDDATRPDRWATSRLRRLDAAEWPTTIGPFRAGDRPVVLRSASTAVTARLAPLLALLPPAADDPGPGPATAISVTGCGGGPLRVFLGGVQLARTSEEDLVVETVLSACNQVAAGPSPGTLRFHAGVVERDGRAVLICGTSGAGKSSLTAACTSAGWHYLTDEVAIVGASSWEVTPYPKWLDLGTDALARVSPGAADALSAGAFEHHLDPSTFGAVSSGARVIAVVALDRHGSSSSTAGAPRPLPTHEALAALLPHVFPSTWDDPTSLQGLADLCAAVPVARLGRSTLDAMLKALASLTDGEERTTEGSPASQE